MRKQRHDFNTSIPWIPNKKGCSLLQCSCSNTCSSNWDLFKRDVGQLLQTASNKLQSADQCPPLLCSQCCSIVLAFGIAWVLHHLAVLMHDLCFFGRLGAALAMGLRRPAAVLHSSSITACGLQVREPPSTASQVSRYLPLHTLSASFLIRAQSLWIYDIMSCFFIAVVLLMEKVVQRIGFAIF